MSEYSDYERYVILDIHNWWTEYQISEEGEAFRKSFPPSDTKERAMNFSKEVYKQYWKVEHGIEEECEDAE